MSRVVARSRLVVAVAIASVAFLGCGNDEARLPALDVSRLVQRVDDVRALSDGGDRAAALAGLAELRRDVDDLAAKGSLARPDARRIRRRIAGAERALKGQAPPTPTPSATPSPAASAMDEDEDDDDEDEDDDGKGKGDRGKGKSKPKGGRGG